MTEHACPQCGDVHGHAEELVAEPAAEAIADAAAAIAGEETEQRRITEEGTSEQARIHEEAETERRRIEAEALTEMARIEAEAATEQARIEAESDEAIAEEETEQIEAIVGAEPDGDEGQEEDEGGDGDEEVDEGSPAEPVVEDLGEPTSETAPVAVLVPPQLAEEAGSRHRSIASSHQVSAFRKRRMRR